MLALLWLPALGCAAGSSTVPAPVSDSVAVARVAEARGEGDSLVIRFLDVGQGDATLITLGSRAVLIDAGRGDDIVLVLADHGVDSLVAAIASHNHADHLGGMDAVVADLPVGRYLDNGRPPANQITRDVHRWLDRKQVPRPPPPWDPILLGDVRIEVRRSPLTGARTSENDASLAVLIERGSFRALLTGDSEVEALTAWLATGWIPPVTVLKAAHHGARNGVTPGWLERTRPEVVVISVGAGNTYGHPDPWALRYFQLHDRRVLRTDRDGTVSIIVDRAGRWRLETAGPIAR